MSDDAWRLAILLGLASLPIAIVGALMLVRGRYILFALAVGLVCAVPCYSIGVRSFCVDGAGNLCGLAGVFGAAPLGFSIGVLACAAMTRFFLRAPTQP